MKFYLIKNYQIWFQKTGTSNGYSTSTTVILNPALVHQKKSSGPEKAFLQNVLATIDYADVGPKPSKIARRATASNSEDEQAKLKVIFGAIEGNSSIKVDLRGKLLNSLKKVGGENVMLQIRLKNVKVDSANHGYLVNQNQQWDFETQEKPVAPFWKGNLICTPGSKGNFASFLPIWNSANCYFCADLTIQATHDLCAVEGPSNFNFVKRILAEELSSDVVIVAEDGTVRIKAHKCFLSVCSPVWEAMFKSDLKKSSNNAGTLKLPEMTEKGVRALLAYIYYAETKDAEEDPELALELFKAAHTYNIEPLEQVLKMLLLNMPTTSFTVDIGLELFIFSKQLPDGGDCLKIKSIQVLKTYYKELRASELYENLRKNDPNFADELLESVLEVL